MAGSPPTLRWYQQDLAEGIRGEFRQGIDAVLAVAPTGAGKTILFCYVADGASKRRNRVCIIAHRQELLAQISSALDRFHVPHGMIQPGLTPNPRAFVQVASVQALGRRIKKEPDAYKFDLVIIDEAHHVLIDNTWGKVWAAMGRPPILGVTASPARTDGRGLGKVAGGIFSSLIEVVDVATLVAEGFLVSSSVYAPLPGADAADLPMRGGDYDKAALSERFDKPAITGDAVTHYRKYCDGATAVAFGVDLKHCGHIAGQFSECGYDFRVIDGTMEDRDRRRLIAGLGQDYQGLVSCDLIGEGVDIPVIKCMIGLRKTASLIVAVQQMGRVLRPIYAPGFDLESIDGRLSAIAASTKPEAIILDHVGNTFADGKMKHGVPESPREWSLLGSKKKKRGKGEEEEPALAVRQCQACYAVFMPAPACPHCGTPVVIPGRDVKVVDGELGKVTAEAAQAALDLAKREKRIEVARAKTIEEAAKKQKRIEVHRAESLEELQKIAVERGHHPRWAEHVFNARAGKNPTPPPITEIPHGFG